MAKPNYAFAKHQRDIAKKKKKEEKRRLKEEARQAQNATEDQVLPEEDATQDQNEEND
ncbi:MAG: hypothetical protein U9Q77_00680 [Candidatus Marinimicrobia bacterium]|nr:hypothetical protein [Candidatus Neomarinimicrobiota bacterium]